MKETLKRQIELGELPQGEAIMAERKLAHLFSISRESVRRGLRELIEEGYLKVVPAKGVFVDYRGPRKRMSGGTSTVGYIFWNSTDSEIHSSYFEGLIRGIEQETQNYGLHLMVSAQSGLSPDQLPAMVKDKKVDGILLEGAPQEVYRTIEQHVPAVVICHFQRTEETFEEETGDMVCADNLRNVNNLFSHLYAIGHRRIGFMAPSLEHSSFYERFEGYRLALSKYGVPFREDYVCITPLRPEVRSIQPLLGLNDRPTAVLCGNDIAAIALLEEAQDLGISVPEELSITGFDDVEGASLTQPPLTTVRVSTVEIARLAVRRLVEKMEQTEHKEILSLVPGEIIHRGSCAAPVALATHQPG